MAATKFKVGDKVRVRKDLVPGRTYGGVFCNSFMTELKGKELIILTKLVHPEGYLITDNKWTWTDEMLEPIEQLKTETKRITENIVELDGVRYVKEDSREWLDVPELGISVEIEVHDKNKSWNKLKLSEREDELLTSGQCEFLANSKYAKILKMDGSSDEDDFFIKQSFDLSRKNGKVAWFYADSDYAGLSSTKGSFVSRSYLGVRFIKKMKGGMK